MRCVSFFVKKKKGQVWVETVIYTLIAFVMIGLVLAFARPKIEELRDGMLITQSINMLKEIESTILNIGVPGNQRMLELGMDKGELIIDGVEDRIIFEMESKITYSESGEVVHDGFLIVYTEKIGETNIVTLTRDYSDSYDIRYDGQDEIKTFPKSAVPYKLFLANEGKNELNEKIIIDISVT